MLPAPPKMQSAEKSMNPSIAVQAGAGWRLKGKSLCWELLETIFM
jgi:hypothetical protein